MRLERRGSWRLLLAYLFFVDIFMPSIACGEKAQYQAERSIAETMVAIQQLYVRDVPNPRIIRDATQGMLDHSSVPPEVRKRIRESLRYEVDSCRDERCYVLFVRLMQTIRKSSKGPVSEDQLVKGAIEGMLSSLDSGCAYLGKNTSSELRAEGKDVFGAAGIEIALEEGTLTVVTPMEGGPAERAGLRPRDKILKIDGESAKGLSLTEGVARMRGRIGSKIDLEIMRDGSQQPKVYSLVRKRIALRPLKFVRLEKGYGYIRVMTFAESTDKLLKEAIRSLDGSRPLKGIVLDLRYCPGGLLDQVIKVADVFLTKGMICYVRGRSQKLNWEFKVSSKKHPPAFAITVLANEFTSGGSEIVVEALRDHDRAVILGSTYIGSGSVQQMITLHGGLGIQLTTAEYFTPKGRHIMGEEMIPDVVLDDPSQNEERSGPPGRFGTPKDPLKDEWVTAALQLLKSGKKAVDFRKASQDTVPGYQPKSDVDSGRDR